MPSQEKRAQKESAKSKTTMQRPLKIAGVEVKPGQYCTINIPVARLYTHTEMTMPVHVVHGKKEGPRLFISAAIHGDEIVGVEIIRRLVSLKKIRRLRGTLLTVPVVNVYGFIHQSRYSPDRRDLNRFFPGSVKGSQTSLLANIFMEEIVAGSTHGIDLHTGSNHRINLPHIRAYLDDPETKRLALAFKVPVVVNANIRDGSLRQAVMEREIPMLLYEAGEALRFDEVSIRVGLKGILSIMSNIGMLPQRSDNASRLQPLIANSTTWIRAPASGIFHTKIPLGGQVSENSKVGEIVDPFGENDVQVNSPENGVVIGRLNLPLVYKGDAIFHIASFKEMASIQSTFETFQTENYLKTEF